MVLMLLLHYSMVNMRFLVQLMRFHAILAIDVVEVQVMHDANANISLVHAFQSKKQDSELGKSWINLAKYTYGYLFFLANGQ